MGNSKQGSEVVAVIDTNVFVPAVAGREPECRFYNGAIRRCWKVVISEFIRQEYEQVIVEYGFRPDVIIHELHKLYAMNKYRVSNANPDEIGEELAPRKDRHIVAPCREIANLIVTHDRGIIERKGRILSETRALVMTLAEAQAKLEAP